MTSDQADMDAPRAPKYRHKTSFYQPEAAAKRMRAAFLNTKGFTGAGSLSDFINAAVDEKVVSLEESFNEGLPWQPLGAREIPQGKPAMLPARVGDAPGPKRPTPKLAAAVSGLTRGLAELFGEGGGPNVFYRTDGLQALVETFDVDQGVAAVRCYEAFHASETIEVRECHTVSWEGAVRAALGRERTAGPESPADELINALEKAGAEAKAAPSPGTGEVNVFFSTDGRQAILETYDAGGGESTLRCYECKPGHKPLETRTAHGVAWEDGESIPYSAI